MADTVTIKVDRCTMTLNLNPFFDDSTLVNIKKVFALIAQEPKRNKEAIEKLQDYFPSRANELYREYVEARTAYQNGYVATDFNPKLTPKEKQKIERANKRLYVRVTKMQKAYMRMQKILSIYRVYARTKYNF